MWYCFAVGHINEVCLKNTKMREIKKQKKGKTTKERCWEINNFDDSFHFEGNRLVGGVRQV